MDRLTKLLRGNRAKDLLVALEVLELLPIAHQREQECLPLAGVTLGEGLPLIDDEGTADIGDLLLSSGLRTELLHELLDEATGQRSILGLDEGLQPEGDEGPRLWTLVHVEVGGVDDPGLGA